MKKAKKPSYSFLENPSLLAMGISLNVVIIVAFISVLWWVYMGGDEIFWGIIICGTIELLMVGASLLALPQWYTKITFTEDSIQVKRAFHKPICHPYKHYSYVYRATYWHGSPLGIGYYPQFLVFSRRSMRQVELENINQVYEADKIIKLRITKRRYKKLNAVLPSEARYILERYWGEKYGK